MTEQSAVAVGGAARLPAARLEPDAIGVAQDTVIGMASAAPAVSVGLTLTALATITYYRRSILSNVKDGVILGILPLASAGFLTWVIVKSLQSAPASQNWSLLGIVIVGLVLMLVARFGIRSPFFSSPLESYRLEAEAAA